MPVSMPAWLSLSSGRVKTMCSARTLSLLLMPGLLVCMAACFDPDSSFVAQTHGEPGQDEHVRTVIKSGGVVDSVLPRVEHLRRFHAGLPSVDTLRDASESIESLVARFARAVSTNDTIELNAMVLDRAEFAWLYYPDSPMSRPPYAVPPELLWGQIQASSNKGIKRLLDRLGGRVIRVSDLLCPAEPAIEGENLIHMHCEAGFSARGLYTLKGQLFGSIIERDGRFKFMGFANRI